MLSSRLDLPCDSAPTTITCTSRADADKVLCWQHGWLQHSLLLQGGHAAGAARGLPKQQLSIGSSLTRSTDPGYAYRQTDGFSCSTYDAVKQLYCRATAGRGLQQSTNAHAHSQGNMLSNEPGM